ncbi:glycoside hydrolase family 172 protein [Actinophytocola glycyrrhizae]|uniref:Glycoside hydrolase family 172 protein n=1 Tax=Actinophytocola glycyrrhizae TaxID=2044873 RepID=A0ABV9SEW0_9PSEU
MRGRIVLAAVLGAAAFVTAPAAPADPSTQDVLSARGPVGWQTYRDLTAAAQLRQDSQVRQFSSYDRTGGNDDGFDNTYSCLRHSSDGCVIAERRGAGEIDSMWFTRDYGSMVHNGRIRVELDGRVVVDELLQELVDGRAGAPFVWPLVGNGDDTAGGSVIKVPMPYRESMRVTVQKDPFFYHVTYREFPDARGVTTFNPRDAAQDVVNRLRGFGVRDPKPALPGAGAQRFSGDVAPGAAASVASLSGSGWVSQVRVRLPEVVASPRVGNDGRAFGAGGSSAFTVAVDRNNNGVRLTRRVDPVIANQVARITVDGREIGTVDSGPVRNGQWVDQVIDVPAAVARGKSSLKVGVEYVSSALDVNEFRYDVHSRLGDTWTRTDVLDLGPGHDGEEEAHGYTIRNQSWEGTRVYRYPADPAQVTRSDALLEGARLRATFDGRTTVDAPVGEFFGSGIGEYDTRTLFSSIDATAEGWYTAWWPMPYGRSATFELVNGSGVPITGAVVEVTSARDRAVAGGLSSGRLGYFNATHRRGDTVPDRSWNFLEAEGTGVFYGVTHSMRGNIPAGNRRNYLEGDETVYVDGAASPTLYGTGSEDFYESGWYFRDGTTFVMPEAGNPAYELDGDGCRYDCTGAYRLMVADAVSFGASLRFDIEHGPADNEPADYSSTAYWYGTTGKSLTETDAVDATSDESRAAHGYEAAGETRGPLTSTFEGRGDTTPVTRDVTTATGEVSFTVEMARDNKGVRLLRLGDQNAAYQRATVLVNGKRVGEWLQPLGNTHSRWLEDSFELPASATGGKSSVTVTIRPAPDGPAWSAATYRVLSRG